MTIRIKSVDLVPSARLASKLNAAYLRVMSSGDYILNEEVHAFEQAWSEYNEVPYTIAVGNGFDALQLCLRAVRIGQRDRVRVPEFTAVPVWSAVLAVGATPMPWSEPFPAPACILVNLYGKRQEASECPQPSHLYVIEDSSQSHGLKPIRNATATAFSFYPTKNLGAYGDAGCVCTYHEPMAMKVQALRSYGEQGAINSRLDALQAAFLRVKIPYLDEWNAIRRLQAMKYNDGLADIDGLSLPDISVDHVFHQYVIRTHIRDELKAYLFDYGIQTQIHYPLPPHRKLGLFYSLPAADILSNTVLSLPIGPHLENSDINLVINTISKFFHKRVPMHFQV